MAAATRKVSGIDLYIAQRLKAARKAAGLSQSDAGNRLGLAFQQIQKYEKGSNRISAGALAALAEYYAQPIAWFFPEVVAGRTVKPARDFPAELMSLSHGAALARDFVAIETVTDRHVVASVAAALAKNGAAS